MEGEGESVAISCCLSISTLLDDTVVLSFVRGPTINALSINNNPDGRVIDKARLHFKLAQDVCLTSSGSTSLSS